MNILRNLLAAVGLAAVVSFAIIDASAFDVPTQKTPAGTVKPRPVTLVAPTAITAATTVWNKSTNAIWLTSSFQHPLGLWSDITATNYSNLGTATITNVWDFAYDPAGTNFTTNVLTVTRTCNGAVEDISNTNLLAQQFENATGIRLTKTLVDAAKTTTTGLKGSFGLNFTP